MHLEYFGFARPPFAAEPDTDIFFQEAERTTLLRRIYAEFQHGGPVLRLTGPEGTGKSLLCLLLARLLPAEYQVVCLPSPAGSFDELLRAACVQLGQPPEADMSAWLHERLQRCGEAGKRLLLIIDQAEKMFPAALERLLRTVSAAAAEGQPLLLLLAGRPALNDHINQLLAYCPDMELPPGHQLAPLNEAELTAYLTFRLKAAGLSEEDSRRAFSAEAVRRLHAHAGGSLRLVHLLADQSLQRVCAADRYFPVQAADVPPPAESSALKKKQRAAFSFRTMPLLAAVLLLLCAGLLVRYSGVLRKSGHDAAKNLVTAVPVKPNVLLPDKVTLNAEPELPPEPEPTAEPAEVEATAATAPTGAETASAEPVQETVPPPAHTAGNALPEESLDTPAPAEAASPPVAAVPEKKIVELVPLKRKTRPKSKEVPLPAPAPEPPTQQAAAMERATVPSADQLYQELLAAGGLLKNSRNANRYSIQLLNLPAADGQAKIKELLARDEYLELRSQLKLLRSPSALLVLYGSYASLDEAEAALDNMPLFLRKQHHPSTVPLAEAISRAGN